MTKLLSAALTIGVSIVLLCFLNYKLGGAINRHGIAIFSLQPLWLGIILLINITSSNDCWWKGLKPRGTFSKLATLENATFPETQRPEKKPLAVAIPLPIQRLLEYHCNKPRRAEDQRNFKAQLAAVPGIAKLREGIRKRPTPFSNNVYLKLLITANGMLLLLAGLLPPGFCSLILIFILSGFSERALIAKENEAPFGSGCNHLPSGILPIISSLKSFKLFSTKTLSIRSRKEENMKKCFKPSPLLAG